MGVTTEANDKVTRDRIADLVACQGLEALAAEPADGVAYDGERINPLPADGP